MKILRNNIITLFAIPIIVISFIYIQYGNVFEDYFMANNKEQNVFSLGNQLLLFKSDVGLPNIVKEIGQLSINFIYGVFVVWLLSCLLSSYIELGNRSASKSNILLELLLLTTCFIVFVVPGLNIGFMVLGGILITCILVMVILYWNYERVVENEKK